MLIFLRTSGSSRAMGASSLSTSMRDTIGCCTWAAATWGAPETSPAACRSSAHVWHVAAGTASVSSPRRPCPSPAQRRRGRPPPPPALPSPRAVGKAEAQRRGRSSAQSPECATPVSASSGVISACWPQTCSATFTELVSETPLRLMFFPAVPSSLCCTVKAG